MSSITAQPTTGREEILAAATDLFGEAGYDGVSISAIAKRAGTSKANVFHHFGSKDALFLEVMRAACKLFSQSSADARDAACGFGERLRFSIQRDVELMHANPDRAHLITREVLESGERRGQALAEDVFQDQFRELVALFEEGCAADSLCDDVPPELTAVMMIACKVFLFQSQSVLRHLPGVDFVDDPARYGTLVSRVMLDGLRRRPEPASKGTKT